MTNLLECLMNAKHNLETACRMHRADGNPIFKIGMSQLDNAIAALENGCDASHVLQEGIGAEINTNPAKKE